ncbi:hypothetical protein ACHQM5_027867 [Ranunculus cassubicifolius]
MKGFGTDIDDPMSEVLVHILLWLRVVSLLRFKSICKSWYHLIQNSDFVAQHHRLLHYRINSTSFKEGNGNLIFLGVPKCLNNEHPSYACLLSADKSRPLDLPITEDPFQYHSVEMVASCNGIICLRQYRTICLWNPATKQATNLPSLPVVPVHLRFFIGFGFDAKSNDYKLICFSLALDDGVHVDSIHVYSSKSDFWRIIENDSLHGVYIYSELRTPYRSEVYCCLGSSVHGGSPAIYTFDFGNEVFGSIPLPDSVATAESSCQKLAIIRETIACIHRLRNYYADTPKSCHVEIWMLNDYEIKESWSKLYSIGPSRDWHWVMGFSMNGDFLLFQDDKRLCLYDLVSQDTMHLPVDVCCEFDVVVYEESLISIKRGYGTASRVTLPDHTERMLMSQLMPDNNIICGVDIPHDVVVHILLWLPVVSVMRFMSVCKSWHSLIRSSDFVAQHLRCHHHDDNNFILLTRSPNYYQLFEDPSHLSRSVSCACLLSANKFELLDFPYDYEYWGYGCLNILASCNGIICLQHAEYPYIYLWNPATKQFKAIIEEPWDRCHEGKEFSVGFGFDVNTNDYKVVQFNSSFKSNIGLYSLSTDSWKVIDWKVIDDKLIDGSVGFRTGILTPFQGGIFCWLVDGSSTMILSFDFSNEVFGTIQLPDITNSYYYSKLAIVRENIACLVIDDESEAGHWHGELWVLNEYGSGIQESWTKLYKIGPFPEDCCWLMVYSQKNGDFIMLVKNGQLCLCNLVTGETKNLHVQGPKELASGYDAVLYKESLISITRGHHIMSSSFPSAI